MLVSYFGAYVNMKLLYLISVVILDLPRALRKTIHPKKVYGSFFVLLHKDI